MTCKNKTKQSLVSNPWYKFSSSSSLIEISDFESIILKLGVVIGGFSKRSLPFRVFKPVAGWREQQPLVGPACALSKGCNRERRLSTEFQAQLPQLIAQLHFSEFYLCV